MSGLKFALRRLRATPIFTIFAVITLALGIGATTAIYSVAHAVLFNPLPIQRLNEVVNVYHSDPRRGGPLHYIALSWPDVEEIRRTQDVFSDVMMWGRFIQAITGNEQFEVAFGEAVSGNYFSFVGANVALGRPLQPSDDRAGGPAVAVISDGLWRRRFGGDTAIVGRALHLNGRPFEIVGVMSAAFRGVDMPNVVPSAVWVPLHAAELVGSIRSKEDWTDPERRWVLMKGRLAAGRTMADAQTALTALGARLDQAAPIGDASRRKSLRPDTVRRFHITMASDVRAHESVDAFAVPLGVAMLAAVGLVLLVACTNLANLLLARGARRRQELAVRRALGASRWRLVMELMVESTIVAVAGAAAGLLVARGLMTLLSGGVAIGPVTASVAPQLELSVLTVTALATLASLVVFGLVPAWHNTRASLRSVLDVDGAGAVGRWRGRRALIAAQVAVSVALLVAAAVFVRQFIATVWHDPGFGLERLAAAHVDFRYRPSLAARNQDLLASALHAVQQQPDVESAALVNSLPIYLSGSSSVVVGTEPMPGTEAGLLAAYHQGRWARALSGTATLFQTLGLRFVAGGPFSETDVAAGAPVIVIGRRVTMNLFGTVASVGRTVFAGDKAYTIAGVVDDTDAYSLGRRDTGFVYLPEMPDPSKEAVLVVRARLDPNRALAGIRVALHAVDPELPVVESVTGVELANRQLLFSRIGAETVALLGFFALVLALVGLFGLLSYLVANRRREIGLRIALGATTDRILRMVLGDGLRPVISGSIAGLLAGAVVSYWIGSFVYRRPGFDWTGLVAVPLLLLPAALLACYLPARGAARVDPLTARRDL